MANAFSMLNCARYIFICAMAILGVTAATIDAGGAIEPAPPASQTLQCEGHWEEHKREGTAVCADKSNKQRKCEMAHCSYWKYGTSQRIVPGGDAQMDYVKCYPADDNWQQSSGTQQADVFVQAYDKDYSAAASSAIRLQGRIINGYPQIPQKKYLCSLGYIANEINPFCDPAHCTDV